MSSMLKLAAKRRAMVAVKAARVDPIDGPCFATESLQQKFCFQFAAASRAMAGCRTPDTSGPFWRLIEVPASDVLVSRLKSAARRRALTGWSRPESW